MSSPGLNPGSPKAAERFENVWKHLRELHHAALQEWGAKVSKLKKERCLDAQKLEVFYNRNQQLKEQHKALQDTVSLLEERLRSGECDGCNVLKEDLKNNREQDLRLITRLKNERRFLKDENRKLQRELQKAKMSCSELQRNSSTEQEDGIIPDSPVLHSSLPVANKLRKHRHVDQSKRVRYAETRLPRSNRSLFSELNTEPVNAAETVRTVEVLVPNTCEYDSSQTSGDVNQQPEEAVAETCAFELFIKPEMKSDAAAGRQHSKQDDVVLKPQRSVLPPFSWVHSPGSTTDRSPSLLPHVQRFSQEASMNKAKRKKEEREPEDNKRGRQEEEIRATSPSFSSQRFEVPPDKKLSLVQSAQTGTSKPSSAFTSPTFKNPNVCDDGRRVKALQELNDSQQPSKDRQKQNPEAAWSLDPALAMSLYDSEARTDERHGELADTDCTWISHSVLQRRGGSPVPGPGQKANDSFDLLFDTTACGEYKSYTGSQLGQSQDCEEEEEEEYDPVSEEPPESSMSPRNKAQRPTFPHVAVIRKKDERRKLKGTTCKECEIYYAHLPEAEKQKKLSACSRHRFLYIPPSTPDNFWEVGFPSTQTCIKRGYIKEEKSPQARTRRRQPLHALFSPKPSQEED